MKSKIIIFFFFNILSTLSINVQGQSDTNILVKPERIVTKHTVKIDNKVINYTAVVGTLILKNEKDESIASIGYTAYTKEGEADLSKRPITYSYNGGPGSSSMWLHMGIMGPRRVVVNDPLPNGPAPYKIEDNNYSLLDISDIVMIDPVGTGLSRAVGKSKNSEFWGVDSYKKEVSQLIRDYTNENERWNSPKYLLGESYGTFRSAGVADYLQSRLGIALNGIVLVSNVLDIRTLSFNPGDDISYILNLPSYAAVAWYHNKISPKPGSLTDFLMEVRAFALKEYALALIQGDQLTAGDHDSMIKKLAGYTGISTSYWAKANLRVNQPQFCQELLRDEGLIVGRLDARYTRVTQNLLSEYAFEDPQSSDISPAYISSFMHYFTTELKVGKDKKYNSSAYGLTGFDWDWKHKRSEGLFGDATSPNTGPDLIHAMSNNPRLKVLVLNGIYDLATPFGASEYTFDHLGLQPKIRSNISHKYYEAGHMMYVQSESASKFKKDVAEFILSGLK
ncbi:MAG: carboxypeptidase [Saprospiraceae bacterium]|nr:carboxypeptidase [Saprospiraceae bacterium]